MAGAAAPGPGNHIAHCPVKRHKSAGRGGAVGVKDMRATGQAIGKRHGPKMRLRAAMVNLARLPQDRPKGFNQTGLR